MPRKSMPTHVILALATALFLGLVLSWGYITARLTSAPYLSVAHLERRVSERILPEIIQRHRPKNMDQFQHFFFYMPFGLLAGIGAELARAWWRGRGSDRLRWRVLGLLGFAALAWAALHEWNQRAMPDRVASWGDLIAGWLGILAGMGLYAAAVWLVNRGKSNRQRSDTHSG